MPKFGEAKFGSVQFGRGLSVLHTMAKAIKMQSRIRDSDKVLLPMKVIDGYTSWEEKKQPAGEASVSLANPGGIYNDSFVLNQTIYIEVVITFSDGLTSICSMGMWAIRKIRTKTTNVDDELELSLIQQASSLAAVNLTGDLEYQSRPTATAYGLLAPDNITASIQGIMAWLLITGGCDSVRIIGAITRTYAYTVTYYDTDAAADVYVGPFNSAYGFNFQYWLNFAAQLCHASFYVDNNNTGVIIMAPQDSDQLMIHRPPSRTFTDRGIGMQIISLTPAPKQVITVTKTINQPAASGGGGGTYENQMMAHITIGKPIVVP